MTGLGEQILFWILAPIAVLLAYPVVWFHSLSTLVAIVTPLRPATSAPGSVS